jgi:uracil-DNA glycosylase
MLWGKFAQEKRMLIGESKHLVLKAAHPSPLSANAGFFGCRHFSKANEYLVSNGIDPIDWNL